MLKELTPEQKALIPIVQDEWLSPLFGPDGPAPLDREKCKDGIEWLYELAGFEKPIIFFLDSPFGCQLAANMVKKFFSEFMIQGSQKSFEQVKDQIGDWIHPEVGDEIQSRVGSEVWDQTWNGVVNRIGAQIWNQVQTQVEDQISELVQNQVDTEVQNKVFGRGWGPN